MNKIPLQFPPLKPVAPEPSWENGVFSIAKEQLRVLEYSSTSAGWNDTLTSFHEDHAGADHFIDRASRTHTVSQLNQHLKVKNPIIMEIGCSSGHLLAKINKEIPDAALIGADIVYTPLLKLAEKYPNIPMLRFDLLDCPLPDNCLDAIILLNVLEHIEDDVAALKQIKRMLKPGGIAIIEVPAGAHLYDLYDKELLHFRRYSLLDLSKKIQALDFNIINKSHLGFFIYPGFWWVKQRNKRLLNLSPEKQQQIVAKNISSTGSSNFLHKIMQLELTIGKWINFPAGIRCLLTCTPHAR